MTILWCGGEDIDFVSYITLSTTTSTYRTGYSRCSNQCTTAGVVLSRSFSPTASAWLSVQMKPLAANYWKGTNYKAHGFFNTSSGAWIGVGCGSATGKVAILTYDGTTTTMLAEETGTSITLANFYKIDMQVQSYGASGTVNVYVDGVLAVSYTGNISVLSETALDAIKIFSVALNTPYSYYSEFIVADEDTRLMALKTLAPNAAGDASEWTNNYTSIDEVAFSDADTIFTSTVDQSFQCNLTGMPTGDFICKGVKMTARATDGVGGIGIQMGVKTNSTVDLGTSVTLGGVWETVEKLYQNNPVTSNRFTPVEIEALQFAVKSVAV